MPNSLRYYWGGDSAPPDHSSPAPVVPGQPVRSAAYPMTALPPEAPASNYTIPSAALSGECTPRHTLIENLAKRLMEERLLYIRGPPVSGKSVLMFLLQEYLKTTYPDHKIRSLTWPQDMSDSTTYKFLDSIWDMTMDSLVFCMDTKILLIDEAQRS
jgi:hypothetical protein